MIYLRDNPLLREPLKVDHVKRRLLGHWGTSPALSFVWAHLNRLIKRNDLDVIFMAGPGHGAPGVLGPSYLEGMYSEVYPDKSPDAAGLQKFFKQFSFPGHIGSHVTPETPGSIHQGGELGYSLSHPYGACFDSPGLIVACVVGDGAVLPILNLNGYKDRFTLVMDVIDRVPGLAARAAHLKEQMKDEIILNLAYAHEHGTDRDEITNWVWPM